MHGVRVRHRHSQKKQRQLERCALKDTKIRHRDLKDNVDKHSTEETEIQRGRHALTERNKTEIDTDRIL